MTRRGTPATFAGTAFISTDDGIGGGAARHIEADRLDRGPAVAELDAERIDEALVGGLLPAVIGLDALARERQGIERAAVAGRRRHVDLIRRHAQAAGVEIDAVEFAGQLDERAVAARAHVGNDGAHRRSTSAAASRLAARNARKRAGKSAALASRRIGMAGSSMT